MCCWEQKTEFVNTNNNDTLANLVLVVLQKWFLLAQNPNPINQNVWVLGVLAFNLSPSE